MQSVVTGDGLTHHLTPVESISSQEWNFQPQIGTSPALNDPVTCIFRLGAVTINAIYIARTDDATKEEFEVTFALYCLPWGSREFRAFFPLVASLDSSDKMGRPGCYCTIDQIHPTHNTAV